MAAEEMSSPRDCIIFSTADWHSPYRTNKQHMALTMARRGWRVLYVETPGARRPRLGSGRDWRRLARRLAAGLCSLAVGPAKVGEKIWVLSPLVPPASRSGLARMAYALFSLALRRAARRLGFRRPVLWTYHPALPDLGDLEAGPLVYHCVDDIAAIPGVDAAAFRRAEDALLRRADLVFATSESLAERCRAINPNTLFLPNVADAAHFGAALEEGPIPADLAEIPEPRLVYHGVVSDFKLDLPLLIELADLRPEWHIVLIGDEREAQRDAAVAELRRRPNVHLLGYRPYERLPDYLRGMAVGLLPQRLNDYTAGMFPMKFHEYLAAGLPVAATPLAFARGGLPFCETGSGAVSFAKAVEKQLKRGRLTKAEARAAVGENTWDRRMERMVEALDGLERRV